MSNRNRLIPMTGYGDDIAAARKSTREQSLLALERQLDVLRWLETEQSVVSYQHFMQVYGYRKVDGRREEQGRFLHADVQRLLSTAPTYFVSHDMVQMVQMAAEVMPSEGLSPTDLPSPTGFLSFDHPLEIRYAGNALVMPGESEVEVEGSDVMRLAAFAWRDGVVLDANREEAKPGVHYYLFMDHAEASRTVFEPTADGEMINTPASEIGDVFGPLPIYDFSGWIYGTPWSGSESVHGLGTLQEDGSMIVAPVVDATRRALLTVWKMLQEKIVSLETERPYRALRRRASLYMPETGDIVVVRLRKEYNPTAKYSEEHGADDEEFEGPWYNHRFLVSGHWKRQRFGTGMSESKIIWVAPYIKGPEDRPFIAKDRIFSLEA